MSLIIRQVKIKTTFWYYYILIRTSKIKMKLPNTGEDVELLECSNIAGRNVEWHVRFDNNLRVSDNTKHTAIFILILFFSSPFITPYPLPLAFPPPLLHCCSRLRVLSFFFFAWVLSLKLLYDLAVPLLEIFPREMEPYIHTKIYANVYSDFIHNHWNVRNKFRCPSVKDETVTALWWKTTRSTLVVEQVGFITLK